METFLGNKRLYTSLLSSVQRVDILVLGKYKNTSIAFWCTPVLGILSVASCQINMAAFGHEGMEDGHNHQNSYTAKPRGRRVNATVCLFERVLYRWNSVKLVFVATGSHFLFIHETFPLLYAQIGHTYILICHSTQYCCFDLFPFWK